jgi:hypothetical protein
MDIKKSIYTFLRAERGCKLSEAVGIVDITTPTGDVWDMTVPMLNEEKTKAKIEASYLQQRDALLELLLACMAAGSWAMYCVLRPTSFSAYH